MTKDFAKKTGTSQKRSAATKTAASPSSQPIKPFFFGTIFGVLLCLALQWLLSNNSNSPAEPSTSPPETTEPRKPELNFYETLTNAEVIVSEEAIAYEADKVAYLLQAGSFRREADADAMRVQLILLNLDAEIRKFESNGELWHRVIVGPFNERSKMAKTRSTLLENGIESLLLTQSAEN